MMPCISMIDDRLQKSGRLILRFSVNPPLKQHHNDKTNKLLAFIVMPDDESDCLRFKMWIVCD